MAGANGVRAEFAAGGVGGGSPDCTAGDTPSRLTREASNPNLRNACRLANSAPRLSRACVARSHRSKRVLFLLWKGLALYVAHNQARYLFGCCSLTSQSAEEGWRVFDFLERQKRMHPELVVAPRPEHALEDPPEMRSAEHAGEVELPILFKIYLRFGSKVCGRPAIDREFKTIDYLVVLDVDAMSRGSFRLFFG